MAVDGQKLKTEIDTDPVSMGYAGKTDQEQADLCNSNRTGTSTDIQSISGSEMQGSIIGSEHLDLTDAQRGLWLSLLIATSAGNQIDLTSSLVRDQIREVWGDGTTSRINLLNIQTRELTRSEEAFIGDLGDVVTETNVIRAKRHY